MSRNLLRQGNGRSQAAIALCLFLGVFAGSFNAEAIDGPAIDGPPVDASEIRSSTLAASSALDIEKRPLDIEAAPDVETGGVEVFGVFTGLGLVLGVAPTVASAFLLTLPFGFFAAPLFFVLPVAGAYLASVATAFWFGMEGVEALIVGVIVAIAGVAVIPPIWIAALLPLAEGFPTTLDVSRPALSLPEAVLVAGAVFWGGTALVLAGAGAHTIASNNDDQE